VNIYNLHLKYLYRKKTYISLNLILSRTRQIRYLRQLLGLNRVITITIDILNEILSSEKQHFAMLMDIRRIMYLLRSHHHIWISRTMIHEDLRIVDAEGLEIRRARKLQRRIFHSAGPDQVWSLDGHDKLKRWGFAIHGCCDGYSRYAIWLRVGYSNNDPRYILSYYLDAIEDIGDGKSATHNRNNILFI
jgi:hypothetical protein